MITVPAEAVASRPTVISVRGEDAAGAAFGHTLIELEPHTSAVVMLDHQGSVPLGRANSPSAGDTESVLYGGPGPRVEGAVDGGPGDIGEAQVVAAGVSPQPGESLGQIDVSAFADHAFGLLDHHPAGQGAGKLLVQALGLGAGAMLHDGQGRQGRRRPGRR